MEIFTNIFYTILYRPLFNALVLLYEYLPGQDLGVAVIALTILTKFAFYPLGVKAIRSQKNLAELQPKIKEIQAKYKSNKEEQARAMMALYKEKKINPLSGCLPILIQLPVLIALFWVLRTFEGGLVAAEFEALYSFVSYPELNTSFLGIIDLVKPSIQLAFVAGIAQFFQTKMTMPKTKTKEGQSSGFAGQMQKQMVYFLPVFTVFILFNLPAAIGLYWLTTTLFTMAQQYIIFRPRKEIPTPSSM